jgi:hypothetical protein
MTVSMHAASVPLFRQLLGSLDEVLKKGEAFAEEKKIDPAVLLQARLAPDMLPLIRQVQIASDAAKGAVARLAGQEPPSFPDEETSFAQLHERMAKTLALLEGMDAARFEGSEDREITVKLRDRTLTMPGLIFLMQWAIPNFTFHCTTAYDILRHNGVEIGKRDFLGKF